MISIGKIATFRHAAPPQRQGDGNEAVDENAMHEQLDGAASSCNFVEFDTIWPPPRVQGYASAPSASIADGRSSSLVCTDDR